MRRSRQFLHILQQEGRQAITVTMAIPGDERQKFVNQLVEAFASDSFSEMAKAWNEERALVAEEAVEKYLLPMGSKWIREYLREEVEDFLANHCGDALYEVCLIGLRGTSVFLTSPVQRINVAPYRPPTLQIGEVPSVLAVSWGMGDPKRDDIQLVVLDEAGRCREYSQIDNLQDTKNKDEFKDLIKRRRPDVIVVGGFSLRTTDLAHKIKLTLRPHQVEYYRHTENIPVENDGSQMDPALNVPVIYSFDECARLYQNSRRSAQEFPDLSVLQRYCVGLARYVQSPLNEFAAAGRDITAIALDVQSQPLVRNYRVA